VSIVRLSQVGRAYSNGTVALDDASLALQSAMAAS
jgi:hypothetical protein